MAVAVPADLQTFLDGPHAAVRARVREWLADNPPRPAPLDPTATSVRGLEVERGGEDELPRVDDAVLPGSVGHDRADLFG